MEITKLLCILLFTFSAVPVARCDDQVIRDRRGRIIAKISDSANGRTVRDENGKITGRIEDTATGKIVRDANGRISGRIESASALT